MLAPEIKAAVDEVLASVKNIAETLRTETKAQFDAATRRADEVEALLKRARTPGSDPGGDGAGFSLAKTIWDHPGFQEFKKAGKGRLVIPIETKTTITSAAVGSATSGILAPQRIPGIQTPPAPRLRVRDLLPQYPTTANAIEGIKRATFTNAAAVVAETSTKAESAITWAIESWPVRTLAHWIPAAKQVMDDWGELRNAVDETLIEGLRDAEDTELLTGDGTGQHLHGLTVQATAYDTADDVEGDTFLDTLNHALKQLEVLNYVPDGIVLHPADWRKISLIKTEDGGANKGAYLLPPNSDGRVWNVSIATTTAMTEGQFLVGAFRRAASIRDRQRITVDISDSHDQFFIANMLAIRAEMRLALVVRDPAALVYGSFPA